MNKRIITIILALAAVCGGASAQPKVNGRAPIREKRGYDQRIAIDTANVRVLYALNAKDIKDEDTYIDLGKLEVGKRVKKYSSEFIHLSDQERKDIKVMPRKVFGLVAEKTFGRIGANWCILTISSVVTS